MDVDDEDKAALGCVHAALVQLRAENDIWARNLSVFERQDIQRRLRWWRWAQRQAEDGQVPMYQTLLRRVLTVRMMGNRQ